MSLAGQNAMKTHMNSAQGSRAEMVGTVYEYCTNTFEKYA
jgi:hypothetical protein